MKTKTSVTLSKEIVAAIDKLAGRRGRSAVVELALRSFLTERARAAASARDLALLNRHAKELNAEAVDVLAFQTLPDVA
jgi:metal-responsive CopG/Arc/MetJ family transcriptional regulator